MEEVNKKYSIQIKNLEISTKHKYEILEKDFIVISSLYEELKLENENLQN